MSKMFYLKLALQNIKKNAKMYIPYMITFVGAVAMYYIMLSLAKNTALEDVFGGKELSYILLFGTWILAFFCVVFLFYTNSFLIKRRKKEFGLFNIMGMEKRHIARILSYETICTTIVCLIVGIVVGILFSQLFYLILLRVVKVQVVMHFQFNVEALLATIGLFVVIAVLTFLNSLRQIQLANPIELLHGDKVGEREPKTKWLLTLIGFICLGSGYYMAVTAESPLEVLGLFLVAIILVMIGTYCLFTAGSVALLKCLKRNKKYYYQTKHFTTVSGMIYRMKQNAVGLANICILSTGILLMVSAAVSLYIGTEDLLETRYPRDFMIEMGHTNEADQEDLIQAVDTACNELGIQVRDEQHKKAWLAKAVQVEQSFVQAMANQDVTYLYFMPLSLYNQQNGTDKTLRGNEVLLSVMHGKYTADQVVFGGESFAIKEHLAADSFGISVVEQMYCFVVPDVERMTSILGLLGADEQEVAQFSYHYNFNTGSDIEVQAALEQKLYQYVNERETADAKTSYYIGSKESSRQNFYNTYGGLFFVGIFMGIVFLMTTVLIIYYKQISEGYDDAQRFKIMKKVGMSYDEIRKSIHSQVLTVFFIPLGMACVHMCFAFPIMKRLLAMLNLTNNTLYALGCVATVLVFAVIYGLVYRMTARIYYRIVSKA